MSSKINWQEPPADKRGNKSGRSDEITAIVNEMQANPGKWALVRQDVISGHVATWKKRGCEVRTSTVSPGKVDVYARWPEQVAA